VLPFAKKQVHARGIRHDGRRRPEVLAPVVGNAVMSIDGFVASSTSIDGAAIDELKRSAS
jgi:hypothetical protein